MAGEKDDEASYLIANRLFWTFLYLLGIFRLAYIVVCPIEVTDEEAYLWDYGRRLFGASGLELAPLGWLTALLGWLGQNSVYLLRGGALLTGSLTLVYIFRLTRRIYNPWVGFWTITALVATPGNAAQNLFLSVEGVLLLCWVGTLYGIWRVISLGPDYRKWIWITALFFLIGTSVHFSMLVFAALGIVFIIMDRECRAWLGKLSFWLTVLALCVATYLFTLAFTKHHEWFHWFADSTYGLNFSIRRLLQYGKDQTWLISPVTWLLIMVLSVLSILYVRRLGRPERYLTLFSSPGILFIMFSELFASLKLDAATVFYAGGIILLAGWSSGLSKAVLPFHSLRVIFHPGIVLGAFWTMSAYLIPFGAQDTVASLGPPRFLRSLEGWGPLYERAQTVKQRWVNPDQTFYVSLGPHELTSRLSFNLREEPLVYRWATQSSKPIEAFWRIPGERTGEDAVIILPGENARLPKDLRDSFREMVYHSDLELLSIGFEPRPYTIYLGIEYRP